MKKASRRKKRLREFARKLNSDLPRSEIWFQTFWKQNELEDKHDQYNSVWCRRIPDVVNHYYRYVIEIDGSSHLSARQKKIDEIKDRFYKAQGYDLFRIKAYNDEELMNAAECIERLRDERRERLEARYAAQELERLRKEEQQRRLEEAKRTKIFLLKRDRKLIKKIVVQT